MDIGGSILWALKYIAGKGGDCPKIAYGHIIMAFINYFLFYANLKFVNGKIIIIIKFLLVGGGAPIFFFFFGNKMHNYVDGFDL